MTKKQKRIVVAGVFLIFLIIVGYAGIRYIPFNRILRVSSSSGSDLVKPKVLNQSPNSLYFDFEIDPKTGDKNGLYQGIAHSGQFSAKVFGKNSYSITINRTPAMLGFDKLDAVGLSCWVYVMPTKKDINGALVLSVNNKLGINVFWKGVFVSGNDIPVGRWFKISGLFDLSTIKWNPDDKIQIYFWNDSYTDILVDDYYIVFGGGKERRGDSALVDMTRQGYQPRFNFPPFPVIMLEKEEIHNNNNFSLLSQSDNKKGKIALSDRLLAGKFTSSNDGRDDLLILKNSGQNELYHYCPDQASFSMTAVNIQPDLLPSFQKGIILSGNFSSTSSQQLVIISEKGIILGGFDKVGNPCSTNSEPSKSFKTIWKSEKDQHGNWWNTESKFCTGDFDGDQYSELLVTNPDGSWSLFKLPISGGNSLTLLASGTQTPEWELKKSNFSIASGKFMKTFPSDLILTVFQSLETKKKGYQLLKYDPVKKQFQSIIKGKTMGLDTLQTGDLFFTGHFDQSGMAKVFRYNRDWRYDLKEIRFSDSTFQIISNLDFSGYEMDHNPKYYESLKIIPGRFIDPLVNSFLVVAGNTKKKENNLKEMIEYREIQNLPNSIQIYRYPKTGK